MSDSQTCDRQSECDGSDAMYYLEVTQTGIDPFTGEEETRKKTGYLCSNCWETVNTELYHREGWSSKRALVGSDRETRLKNQRVTDGTLL